MQMSVSCRESFQQDINFQKKISQKQIRCDPEVQSSLIEQLDLENNVSDPGSSSSFHHSKKE